jgi:hypothetical protein
LALFILSENTVFTYSLLSNDSSVVVLLRLCVVRERSCCDAEAPEFGATWAVTLLTGAPGVVKALTPIPTMPTTIKPETSAEAIKELNCFILLVSLQAAL